MADNKKEDNKKSKNPEITDKVDIDTEPELSEALYYILGEDESLDDVDNIVEEFIAEFKELGEAVSTAQRIQRRQKMRRYRSRINIARKRSMRRRATTQKIGRRARRSAVKDVKKRYASGKDPSKLSYAERSRVEKMASTRKGLVKRNTRKLIRTKRAQERDRMSRKKK